LQGYCNARLGPDLVHLGGLLAATRGQAQSLREALAIF
jgi:hypothetical protein